MEVPNFRLNAEEYEKIVVILTHLAARSEALSICLINRNGQEIASQGETDEIDLQALASLAASNLAATFGLASLIGEREFKRLYHRGERNSIIINPVGSLALVLMVIASKRADKVDMKSLSQAALILEDVLKKCNQD